MNHENARRVFMPYCLKRLADGRYILLNRLYAPIGTMLRDQMDFTSHPGALHIHDMTPAKAKSMSHDGNENMNEIYLFADIHLPTNSSKDWNAYSERLRLLMDLEFSSK